MIAYTKLDGPSQIRVIGAEDVVATSTGGELC